MKSNRNFQKSKKSKSFDEEREMKVKKVGASAKKKKNFKQEIFAEIDDEDQEIDLFGKKDDSFEDDEDTEY